MRANDKSSEENTLKDTQKKPRELQISSNNTHKRSDFSNALKCVNQGSKNHNVPLI